MGCPIGLPDHCEEVFSSRLSKVKVSLGALHVMCDAQVECNLLRSCLALHKLSFILCSCLSSHIHCTAAEFDSAIHCTLETNIGGLVSYWSWLKASLPCSHCGLNLCNTVCLSPAAFLGSIYDSKSQVH